MIRSVFVFLHRWVGLLMAVFLVIVGLTGSLLAFNMELDHVFAARLYAKPRPGVAPLDIATLLERAPVIPHARVVGINLRNPEQAAIAYLPDKDPATGKPYRLAFTQLVTDPWTGEELGRRTKGDISEGMINFMPFVYRLHDMLLWPGVGGTILGIVAIFWTLDCFNGFYLTLPVSLFGFWRKWKAAWMVKRRAGFYRLNFDLHRASGLWLWPVLLVFAWSSVMFNLRPVYEWTMSKLMSRPSMMEQMQEFMNMPRRTANPTPALDARSALEVGRRLVAEQARAAGRDLPDAALSLNYQARMGVYIYSGRSRDAAMEEEKGEAPLGLAVFDGDTGERVSIPNVMMARKGFIIDRWLAWLHMARVFGLPYKIFVCALGLVIAMLSATGVYIWWTKRKARCFRKTQTVSAGATLEATAAE